MAIYTRFGVEVEIVRRFDSSYAVIVAEVDDPDETHTYDWRYLRGDPKEIEAAVEALPKHKEKR